MIKRYRKIADIPFENYADSIHGIALDVDGVMVPNNKSTYVPKFVSETFYRLDMLGIPYVALSNCSHERALILNRILPMKVIRAKWKKPLPSAYSQAAEAMQIDRRQMLAVDDKIRNVLIPKLYGITTAWVHDLKKLVHL